MRSEVLTNSTTVGRASSRAVALSLLLLAAAGAGCDRKQPPINDAEAKAQLEILQQKAGLTFPSGVRLLNHNDGGGRDASHGFYNWTVFTPSAMALPKMKEAYVTKGYLDMPLEDSIRLLKVSAKGEDFSDALQAMSSNWETNGYDFSATLVRTKHGDYVHITTGKSK